LAYASFFKAFGANTAKRQILSSTGLRILAAKAAKISPANAAGLRKHNLRLQNVADSIAQLVNVVVIFDAETSLITVIISAKPHQQNEFFSLNSGKPKTILIQNNHNAHS
jgi:hypothetical protein